MRHVLLFVLLITSVSAVAGDASTFERFFTNATLRVDYYHTGAKTTETFSIDQSYQEGPWAGSRVNLIDTLNLGEYMVRVYDKASSTLIYSRGYSTIFNEWQTTDEAAAGITRTFSESAMLPFPKAVVQFTISRRDRQMVFHEVFSALIDPSDPTQVDKRKKHMNSRVTSLMNNGPSAEKVDLVILGDGYAKDDMMKLRADAKRFNDVMFETEPFKSRKKDFNVWLIEVESHESGISIPDKDVWKDNPLGTQYNTFGSARYVLTTNNRSLRDYAGTTPYDFIAILVNDTRYGGGGIYNLYATTYTGETVKGQEWQMEYVYVHEFGHSFGGLGDEYYSSSTSYNDFYPLGVEPWEPNITALTNKKNVKWKHLLTEAIAIPTPWEKNKYDSVEAKRSKLDRLAADYYEKREPLFKALAEIRKDPRFLGKVGAFEGAGYSSKGLYRPSLDCRMFSLSLVRFDPVCSEAIERVIDFYAR